MDELSLMLMGGYPVNQIIAFVNNKVNKAYSDGFNAGQSSVANQITDTIHRSGVPLRMR